MKNKIIELSKNLNIDIVGFCDAKELDYRKDFLISRKSKGLYCEFEEEDIRRKIEPSLLMPNAKSIIVIGISYYNRVDNYSFPENYGLISKSSWGMDYHSVLRGIMETLTEKIEEFTPFNYKCFVDTSPLMERELAYKAGIGYFGKNCSIINENYGSFIFLGFIITDLELEADQPRDSKCGDCTLCMNICPTKAIYEPYKVNPTKCLSYITQSKRDYSQEELLKMGLYIYGCDRCQNVCPKNKGIEESNHKSFDPEIIALDLDELENLSNREFKNIYGHLACSWRGKKILIRNGNIARINKK